MAKIMKDIGWIVNSDNGVWIRAPTCNSIRTCASTYVITKCGKKIYRIPAARNYRLPAGYAYYYHIASCTKVDALLYYYVTGSGAPVVRCLYGFCDDLIARVLSA